MAWLYFFKALRDKTLAGKRAVFDVTVLEASKRTVPELTDEFANKVRAGLTKDSLVAELRKAVDSEDAKEFTPARNAALAKALAEVMEVEVPDTLVTNQAREMFALMMADMRSNGVSDEEIKKQIQPENFLKYKKIVKDDIVRDFKVSMATDEIARLEGITVPDYQVEEQMEAIRKDAAEHKEDFDEGLIRSKVQTTLQRQAVMDFLAEHGNLTAEYADQEETFDQALLDKLAEESLEREKELVTEASGSDSTPVVENKNKQTSQEPAVITAESPSQPESSPNDKPDPVKASPSKRDYSSMTVAEKAYYALLDAGALKTNSESDESP